MAIDFIQEFMYIGISSKNVRSDFFHRQNSYADESNNVTETKTYIEIAT